MLPGRMPKPPSDGPFLACLILLAGIYVVLLLLLVAADLAYTDRDSLLAALRSPAIRHALLLSLISCSISAILSLWVALPLGYLMTRFSFPGKRLVDAVLDLPVVLPPMVVGVSLLALFTFPPFSTLGSLVVFRVPAVILAQFTVAAAFAIRALRPAMEQIPLRYEEVAMTLGCSRGQAFWRVFLPQARPAVLEAGALAWARSLGEFGPILVFAGTTRMHTEVLSTSVYLEFQKGDLQGMLAISLIMVVTAALVLLTARALGRRGSAP